MQFVLRNIHMGARFEGVYRQDVYKIPPAAIRELIVNAAVHRSYLDPENIRIALYDNRLEVTSPGRLPMGQTLSRMKEGYSRIRNEALAYAFEYMHLIEHWGSGIPRVLSQVKEAGLREPEFIDSDIDLRINIYRKEYAGNVAALSDSSAGKVPENVQEEVIYMYALDKAGITSAQAAKILDVKQRRARIVIAKMVNDGWLKKEGNGRNIRYIVNRIS